MTTLSPLARRQLSRRARSTPSERNLEVYDAVVLRGEEQAVVAHRLGLSQQRVSQICRQVATWRGAALPAEKAEDREQVERQLLRRRLGELWNWAAGELARSREPTVVKRQVQRVGEAWIETTTSNEPQTELWAGVLTKLPSLMLQLGEDGSAFSVEAELAALTRQLYEQLAGVDPDNSPASETAESAEETPAQRNQTSRTTCSAARERDNSERDNQKGPVKRENGNQNPRTTCAESGDNDNRTDRLSPRPKGATGVPAETCAPPSAEVLARRRNFLQG